MNSLCTIHLWFCLFDCLLSPFNQLPFVCLFVFYFLKLLLPRVHTSESNLIQVDSVLVFVQFKVIFFGSQQNITQSLTELLRIFTPYQQLISNYFSAHRSLKIQDMMICYTFCAETIMKGSCNFFFTRKGVMSTSNNGRSFTSTSKTENNNVFRSRHGKVYIYRLYLNLQIY